MICLSRDEHAAQTVRRMPLRQCQACGDVSLIPDWTDGLCFLCATDARTSWGTTEPSIGALHEDLDGRHHYVDNDLTEQQIDILDLFREAQDLVAGTVAPLFQEKQDRSFFVVNRSRLDWRPLYLARKAARECVQCGSSARIGYVTCWQHRTKYDPNRYLALRTGSVCVRCGHELAVIARHACVKCLRKRADAQVRRKAKYRATGVCVACGKRPNEQGTARCQHCKTRRRERTTRTRRAPTAAGRGGRQRRRRRHEHNC